MAVLCTSILADADPLADLERHCDLKATSEECTAFLAGLAGIRSPTREERVAYLRGRAWVEQTNGGVEADSGAADCGEQRILVQDHPDYPEALVELALCLGMDRQDEVIALLETALAVDPENANALDTLTFLVSYTGDDYGIDHARLARYRSTHYEIAETPSRKLTAASRIYEASVDAGDRAAAKATQDRVRRDAGLDALEYGGERRAESLDFACSSPVFYVDLEEVCVAAIESLAAAAVEAGVPLSDDVTSFIRPVLRHLTPRPHFVGESLFGRLPASEAEYVARLKRVMDAQPEGSRSSEYYRVYSEFDVGPARVAALRLAVNADRGNADAKCSLAYELMHEQAYEEVASIYGEMATANEQGWCDPEEELVRLERSIQLMPPR